MRRGTRPDRFDAATAGGMAAVLAVVFRHALRGEVLFRRDVHLMWYAQVEALVRATSRGEWPLWNPDIGFGQPLWADANTQVLYPPTWLNLVMRPWTYYTLFALLHLALAGLGARLLARVLGLGKAAASLAGVLWVASGPLLSLGEVWNQLAGAAWMPWALVAGIRTLGGGRVRWAIAWAACAAAQVLAGSPEAFLLTAAGALAYGVVARPWRAAEPRVSALRAARASLLALALALGLSAGQWLPSAVAAAQSSRARLSAEAQGYWSVHPLGLVQLFFPLGADALRLRPEAAAVLFGGRDPLLPSLYLGLASLPLVAASVASGRGRRAGWLLAAGAGAAALALGRHSPLVWMLGVLFPPLHALRYPVKAMAAASLCWALAAAAGLDVWLSPADIPLRRWTALVVVPALAAALAAAAGAMAVVFGPRAIGALLLDRGSLLPVEALLAPARKGLTAAAVAGLAMAVLSWRRRGAGRHASRIAMAAAAVAVADLVIAHADLVPTAPRTLFTYRPPALDAARPPDHQRLYAYDYFVPGRSAWRLGRAQPFAIERAPDGWRAPAATALAMRLALFPPSAAPWGVPGSFDLDTPGIAPRPTAMLLDALLGLEGTPAHARLLRLGAVARVAALHDEGLDSLPLLAAVDVLLPERLRVFAVPGALPRAWAVGAARRVEDDAAALRVMIDPGFAPAREVLLADAGPAPSAPSPDLAAVVDVLRTGADRLTVTADLSGPGYLVMADAWAPGWTARVDGHDGLAVQRANVAFRAVPLGTGRHVVELRYRPWSVPTGLALSGASIVAAAALALGGRGPAKEGRPAA